MARGGKPVGEVGGMQGEVVAVCLSRSKGTKKINMGEGRLIEGHGLEGDAHAGDWHRQVSLLALESIDKMRAKGLDVGPGDFAENITTRGIDLVGLPIGTRLLIGREAEVDLTQKGKECHTRCAIYYQAGECVMPTEGVFGRVIRGGMVKAGDKIRVVTDAPAQAALVRVGILTASDKGSRGEREDKSGDVAERLASKLGSVVYRTTVPDDRPVIEAELQKMADELGLDLILTTGGTGLSPRDNTPEATKAVIEKEVPGISEAMRMNSLEKTPHAMLSRGVSGIRGRTLIVNLPGSPRAVEECLGFILPALPHAIEILKGRAGECARR